MIDIIIIILLLYNDVKFLEKSINPTVLGTIILIKLQIVL